MTSYKHIYGPQRSRRLGISLGVDMMPLKVCSLDCVYCECGATTELTVNRREYIPADSIIAELSDYLATRDAPDYVTFGGSGEPTLNSGLGRIIRHLKDNFPSQKLALLTNSTLLHIKQVANDIMPCDVVLPSLDAVTDAVFYEVNKPDPSLDCAGIIEGLAAFSSEYKGELWLEIFIAPGINDTDEEIALFKNAVMRINPTRIQLNSLDRPGTDNSLAAAPRASLEEIARRFAPMTAEIVTRGYP